MLQQPDRSDGTSETNFAAPATSKGHLQMNALLSHLCFPTFPDADSSLNHRSDLPESCVQMLQWEQEKVVLNKEDVLEPDDSRLKPKASPCSLCHAAVVCYAESLYVCLLILLLLQFSPFAKACQRMVHTMELLSGILDVIAFPD